MKIDILIDKYLNAKESIKIKEHYFEATNVKPKNIYTEKTDFLYRYKREMILLNSIIATIPKAEQVFEQIPEIDEYYPFLRKLPLNRINLDITSNLIFKETQLFFNSVSPREYGEYYSSKNLIQILLDNLQTDFSISNKVIDPSCGAGYFLYFYIKKLVGNKTLNQASIKSIKENTFGYDIFPFPIIIAKILLGSLFIEYFPKTSKPFEFKNIKIQNTLKSLTCISKDRNLFDIIIGNPPYFRIDPNDENKICACVSFGHNYIHSLFLHWSMQHLKDGGEMGFILPQSILSGFYYQKLRTQICQELSIELIVTNKTHEKSFSVQQDIMLFNAIKKKKQSLHYYIGVSNESFTKIEKYAVDSRIINNKLKVIPVFRNKEEYENFQDLSNSSIVSYLSKFTINTGNFVWNQNKVSCFSKKVIGSIPLINGPNITLNNIDLNNERNTTFSFCLPSNIKYIKKEKLIVYRRMSPIGNNQRMIAAIIENTDPRFIDGFVIENHVNIINGPKKKLNTILKFITSLKFNILINSFCHTNQVSSNDMNSIFELLKASKND